MLRISISQTHSPSPSTVLGWQVSDIGSVVRELTHGGVQFQRYEFLKQDGLGIWTAPGGTCVAWFKDPDGNVLSLSQHPEMQK
jgi:hypothetical protein